MILNNSAFNSCLVQDRYCKNFPVTEHLSTALVGGLFVLLNVPYIWFLPPTKMCLRILLGSSVFFKKKKIRWRLANQLSLTLLCHFCIVCLFCACMVYLMPQVYCPCNIWLTSPTTGPPHPTQTFKYGKDSKILLASMQPCCLLYSQCASNSVCKLCFDTGRGEIGKDKGAKKTSCCLWQYVG